MAMRLYDNGTPHQLRYVRLSNAFRPETPDTPRREGVWTTAVA
jgi:hypothetical protein